MRGRFITLEGGEGTGKSTQITRLRDRLSTHALDVIATREPGGTEGAEAIRNLVVSGATDRWSPMSEVLLMNAARQDHVEKLIKPALERGVWVICDRFSDSTIAYQGAGQGLGVSRVQQINEAIFGDFKPDLTLILDIDVKEGLSRSTKRLDQTESNEDRFERMDIDFHERLRRAFLDIAAADKRRCCVIDAAQSMDAVESAIWSRVSEMVEPKDV